MAQGAETSSWDTLKTHPCPGGTVASSGEAQGCPRALSQEAGGPSLEAGCLRLPSALPHCPGSGRNTSGFPRRLRGTAWSLPCPWRLRMFSSPPCLQLSLQLTAPQPFGLSYGSLNSPSLFLAKGSHLQCSSLLSWPSKCLWV